LIVEPLTASLLGAWEALFETSECPCYCRYWHFEGDKNAWLQRCAVAKDANFNDQAELVRAADPSSLGLVALDDGRACIGWMKLAPRAALPKLRRLPVYRSLDLGGDRGVYSVGCFLVHPRHRGHNVARSLLAAAETYVAAWGGCAIEGYPRRASHRMHPEEAWMGSSELFEALGYRQIAGEGQYPVFRKDL
jgi:GNAT superfamily N-acetyltransferase